MNTLLDRLLAQLESRGLKVTPGDAPGQLKLVGKTGEADPAVMRALKAFKPQLLQRFAPTDAPIGATPSDQIFEPKPQPFTPPAPEPVEPVVVAAAVTVCGDCRRPVDEKRRCWHCHNRPCVGCGIGTGSAFISMCNVCGAQEDRP